MNHESINEELTIVVICGKNSMFLKSVTKPITLPKRIKYLRFHKKNFLFVMAATYPEGGVLLPINRYGIPNSYPK